MILGFASPYLFNYIFMSVQKYLECSGIESCSYSEDLTDGNHRFIPNKRLGRLFRRW